MPRWVGCTCSMSTPASKKGSSRASLLTTGPFSRQQRRQDSRSSKRWKQHTSTTRTPNTSQLDEDDLHSRT